MQRRYLCLIFIPFVTGAEIYKCVNNDGQVVYRDTPCRVQDTQTIYSYNQDFWPSASSAQELNQYRKCLTRERSRKQKWQEREQKRRLRLRARCERVTQKIELLNQRYRRGYTAKQRQMLDRKLAEYNKRRQKYCK